MLLMVWFPPILSLILVLLCDLTPVIYGEPSNVGSLQIRTPTVFWINLPENKDRADHTNHLLHKHGFFHSKKVDAISPNSPEYNLKLLEKPCKRNTDRDIAVILSHLKAIYHALNEDPQPDNPFALIIEDDIRFMYSINFTDLILSAPRDFGILQLTTSSPDAIQMLLNIPKTDQQLHNFHFQTESEYWHKVNWKDTTKNKKEYLFWSAQAYIIQKSILRTAMKYVVQEKERSSLSFKVVNSFFPNQCSFEESRPCVLANCLFADTYIYSLGKPTYVSRIPLVTGSKVGLNSTIHQGQVEFHKEGFSSIRKVYSLVRRCILNSCEGLQNTQNSSLLSGNCFNCTVPSFVKLL